MDRDEVRDAFAALKINSHNWTLTQARVLASYVNLELSKSANYEEWHVNEVMHSHYLTCGNTRWESRELISFNQDGFIGIAGWADSKNAATIIGGIQKYLESRGMAPIIEMKSKKKEKEKEKTKDPELINLANRLLDAETLIVRMAGDGRACSSCVHHATSCNDYPCNACSNFTEHQEVMAITSAKERVER